MLMPIWALPNGEPFAAKGPSYHAHAYLGLAQWRGQKGPHTRRLNEGCRHMVSGLPVVKKSRLSPLVEKAYPKPNCLLQDGELLPETSRHLVQCRPCLRTVQQ